MYLFCLDVCYSMRCTMLGGPLNKRARVSMYVLLLLKSWVIAHQGAIERICVLRMPRGALLVIMRSSGVDNYICTWWAKARAYNAISCARGLSGRLASELCITNTRSLDLLGRRWWPVWELCGVVPKLLWSISGINHICIFFTFTTRKAWQHSRNLATAEAGQKIMCGMRTE